MAVLKCKMCGGDLNFEEGATVVECEYCGTKQTVPTIDDEKKITLFARANRLRFACEFDKASGIYESIVADFPTEAEAYWGLVLCKYGIEYVDDPATGKKIPTCHRSSFDSVMEDANFDLVLENADPIARSVYREEAKQIEELRRGIIEVSNKEEPYDIFICYKETAENGERTIDSVIAQDVYNELTEKGYRVFFSRITLEDKLGQEYEPYIFAALNSAKIMLAFGTDYEYYNAVWVKNEWSRFLQLIARGEKKTLIPCYKNIDAYDMPKEFARLQAQDMGKVGAMQDLLRGIEKLLPRRESEQTAQAQPGIETVIVQQRAQSATVDSLLKRAFLYLEDSDWSNAVDYINRVLDIAPENAEAYVGLLMAELQVRKEDDLARQTKSFDQNKHFIKAVRFAGEERRKVLEGYIKVVMDYLTEQQDSLLKQAFMYLEDSNWSNAADYCNRVLDILPESTEAYVGLLMAELQVKKEDELARQTISFGQNEHFLKAVRFAGEERRKVLESYKKAAEDYIAELREKERQKRQQLLPYEEEKIKLIKKWMEQDNKLNELKKKLSELKKKLNELVKKLDPLRDAKECIEWQLKKLNESRSQYQEKLKELVFFGRSRKEEYTTKIDKLDLQRSDLNSEYDKINSNIIKTESDIKETESHINETVSHIKEIESHINETVSHINETVSHIKDIQYLDRDLKLKYVCQICGYHHEGSVGPEMCPICQSPAYRFRVETKSANTTPSDYLSPSSYSSSNDSSTIR